MAAAAAAGGDDAPRLYNNANFLHVQRAKDIAKQYEGHAEKFAQFIREFQSQDTANTQRWARKKYMQKLQNIANKQSRMIQIDLDDLDTWSDGQDTVEKDELSVACERYILHSFLNKFTHFYKQNHIIFNIQFYEKCFVLIKKVYVDVYELFEKEKNEKKENKKIDFKTDFKISIFFFSIFVNFMKSVFNVLIKKVYIKVYELFSESCSRPSTSCRA